MGSPPASSRGLPHSAGLVDRAAASQTLCAAFLPPSLIFLPFPQHIPFSLSSYDLDIRILLCHLYIPIVSGCGNDVDIIFLGTRSRRMRVCLKDKQGPPERRYWPIRRAENVGVRRKEKQRFRQ